MENEHVWFLGFLNSRRRRPYACAFHMLGVKHLYTIIDSMTCDLGMKS